MSTRNDLTLAPVHEISINKWHKLLHYVRTVSLPHVSVYGVSISVFSLSVSLFLSLRLLICQHGFNSRMRMSFAWFWNGPACFQKHQINQNTIFSMNLQQIAWNLSLTACFFTGKLTSCYNKFNAWMISTMYTNLNVNFSSLL